MITVAAHRPAERPDDDAWLAQLATLNQELTRVEIKRTRLVNRRAQLVTSMLADQIPASAVSSILGVSTTAVYKIRDRQRALTSGKATQ